MSNPWTQQQVAAMSATGLPSDHAVDEEKLRKMWHRFEVLYNKHDAKGIANLYAPDGDRINPQGQFARGRVEVQKQYEAIPSTGSGHALKTRLILNLTPNIPPSSSASLDQMSPCSMANGKPSCPVPLGKLPVTSP